MNELKIGVIGIDDYSLSFSLLCTLCGFNLIIFEEDEIKIKNLSQKFYITDNFKIIDLLYKTDKIKTTSDFNFFVENSEIIFSFKENETNNFVYLTSIIRKFSLCLENNISVFEKFFIIGQNTNFGESLMIEDKLSEIGILFGNINKIDFFNSNINKDTIIVGCKSETLFNNITNIFKKILKKDLEFYSMSCSSLELCNVFLKNFENIQTSFLNLISTITLNEGLGSELNIILKFLEKNTDILKVNKFGLNQIKNDEINKLENLIKSNNVVNNFISPISKYNSEFIKFIKNYYIKLNSDNKNPFVLKNIIRNGYKTLKYDLCLELLNEGYYVHIVDEEKNFEILKSLIEYNDSKVRFFKPNTNPSGFIINL